MNFRTSVLPVPSSKLHGRYAFYYRKIDSKTLRCDDACVPGSPNGVVDEEFRVKRGQDDRLRIVTRGAELQHYTMVPAPGTLPRSRAVPWWWRMRGHTSHGTGGIVTDVECPHLHVIAVGREYPHFAIIYVPANRLNRHTTLDRNWINECVAVNGCILMLLEANTDEVFIDGVASGLP